MKTKIATLVLCLVVTLSMSAQKRTDAYFNYQTPEQRGLYIPVLTPGDIGFDDMYVNTPIGNGLFVLLGISVVYLVIKRKVVAV